jgi:hypothetical protein
MTTLPPYDEALARYLAEMNAAAYACGSYEGCGQWACTSCLKHPSMEVLRFASDGTSTSGFVGYDPDAGRIVLAYAGTQPGDVGAWCVPDWLVVGWDGLGCVALRCVASQRGVGLVANCGWLRCTYAPIITRVSCTTGLGTSMANSLITRAAPAARCVWFPNKKLACCVVFI